MPLEFVSKLTTEYNALETMSQMEVCVRKLSDRSRIKWSS
jgi:hypothetical protein